MQATAFTAQCHRGRDLPTNHFKKVKDEYMFYEGMDKNVGGLYATNPKPIGHR